MSAALLDQSPKVMSDLAFIFGGTSHQMILRISTGVPLLLVLFSVLEIEPSYIPRPKQALSKLLRLA